MTQLQSLFTWIFYLFIVLPVVRLQTLIASILIHLDFLSIYDGSNHSVAFQWGCFNPYSPGFSIYLYDNNYSTAYNLGLQSLFTWIFYLFNLSKLGRLVLLWLQSLFTWIFYLFTLQRMV